MTRSPYQVLIIDDDAPLRRSIAVYLEDSGFDVLQAENGTAGIDLCMGQKPDVVLLDLRMPEMDGLECLSRIKEKSPDTPVIVVSGAGVLQDAIQALRLGAFDYITKPILDMAILEHTIQKALERTRLILENRRYHHHLETQIEERTRALKESETRFRELAELLPQTVFEIDREGRFEFINQYGLKSFGYERSQVEAGFTAEDFFAEEDRDRIRRDIEKSISGLFLKPSEYLALRKDGATFPVTIYSSPVVRNEMTVGLRGVIFDLTAIKRTERSLRESQTRFKEIIEVFDGFIYTCDKRMALTFMNRKMINYVGRDAVGEQCHQAVYKLHAPCPWCGVDEVFKGKTLRRETQSPVDGRWYSTIQTPIYGADGKIEQYESIAIDITGRKMAEEALKQSEAHLREENERLRSSLNGAGQFGPLIGKTPAMHQVYDIILKASLSDANVIIYGESGTGKELVARTIQELSHRNRHRFIVVNCGAIPENLIESEFFGYKKGAFTGAVMDKPGFLAKAEGGTVFLDEVGEIPLAMQVKLLRAIAGDGYTPIGSTELIVPDVRFISATNKALNLLVEKGRIREDFYYRLNIIPVYLPALRERRDDIPLLIHHFLQKYAKDDIQPTIPPHTLRRMIQYNWPGNVRELENTIHRYITLEEMDMGKGAVTQGTGTLSIQKSGEGPSIPFHFTADQSLKGVVDQAEKIYIERLLQIHHWHRSRVATILGIDRRTLFRKMKEFGISGSPNGK